MSLIQCKECEHEISKAAKQCLSCGAKNKQKASWGQIAFLVAGGMVLFSILSEPSPNYNNSIAVKTNAGAAIAKSSSKNTASILETPSWSCDQEHGYMFIRGEVKNVSNRPIKNLMAVATFRTGAGGFVKSDDALVEYNPLLPGQTSPFKVGTTHNPASEKCRLSFKTMFGGEVKYDDLKNKKKSQ